MLTLLHFVFAATALASPKPADSSVLIYDSTLHEVVYRFRRLEPGVLHREDLTKTHSVSTLICPHGDTLFIADVWKDGHALREKAIEQLETADQKIEELIKALEAYEQEQKGGQP